MTTIIHPTRTVRRPRPEEPAPHAAFRQPNYDCREQPDAVKLVVYVPGVEASGVDIEGRGSDLTITARKTRFVRVNWASLQLESAQLDYRLKLRLGRGIDFGSAQAEIHDGVLNLTLPKRPAQAASEGASLRRVA